MKNIGKSGQANDRSTPPVNTPFKMSKRTRISESTGRSTQSTYRTCPQDTVQRRKEYGGKLPNKDMVVNTGRKRREKRNMCISIRSLWSRVLQLELYPRKEGSRSIPETPNTTIRFAVELCHTRHYRTYMEYQNIYPFAAWPTLALVLPHHA